MNEPVGIIGICCPDDAPLLSFISLWAPAISMGNRVVVIPSEKHPFAATDFYQILETSDMPDGVINIVTGNSNKLGRVLAEHEQVDAIWYQAEDAQGSKLAEACSAFNLKRTWVSQGESRDWFSSATGQGQQFLRASCEVKNIWIPYGD
jgi:aldehyde dehydrogenase (NAD+)